MSHSQLESTLAADQIVENMTTEEDIAEAAHALASAISDTVQYAIVGGAACALLGSHRQTEDIDIVVPKGWTIRARSALRDAPKFNVEARTNFTTYVSDTTGGTPIPIEILTPPSMFRIPYTEESPVIYVGGIRILHPVDLLCSKCGSVTQRSTRAKRASDHRDIIFLLDYVLERKAYRGEPEITRLKAVATQEWIGQYVIEHPEVEGRWIGLGLYVPPKESS
jgi:hypothetical protein